MDVTLLALKNDFEERVTANSTILYVTVNSQLPHCRLKGQLSSAQIVAVSTHKPAVVPLLHIDRYPTIGNKRSMGSTQNHRKPFPEFGLSARNASTDGSIVPKHDLCRLCDLPTTQPPSKKVCCLLPEALSVTNIPAAVQLHHNESMPLNLLQPLQESCPNLTHEETSLAS